MKNLIDLHNKYFLVTGASSGIGRATSILLSQLGAKVILVSRNEQNLRATQSAMEGNNHPLIPLDLMNCQQLNSLLENIVKYTDKLDGVVHCSGLQIYEPLRFIEEDSMQQTLQLNVMAIVSLTKIMRKYKIFSQNSSIVLLASIVGLMGEAGASVYAASKGAIIALTKSLAVELASDSIRVNCVAPAIVKTPMSNKMFLDVGKERREMIEKKHLLGLGEPKDVANVIAFLLSDAARWITGSCVVADGGYSISS